jgi:hypothetical protein
MGRVADKQLIAYEERFIAFVDILGMRNFMSGSSAQNSTEILVRVLNEVMHPYSEKNSKLHNIEIDGQQAQISGIITLTYHL